MIYVFLSVATVCVSFLVAMRWWIQAKKDVVIQLADTKLREINDRITKLEMGRLMRHG
jgi:hypothetical protein